MRKSQILFFLLIISFHLFAQNESDAITFTINDKEEINLNRIYMAKFSKVVSPTRAVQFMQVMNQIDLIIDVQIASQLPLIGQPIEPVTAPATDDKGSDL